MKTPLTAERLREVLAYDRETGFFTWKVSKYKPQLIGQVAGSLNQSGYWHIGVDGAEHKAHRLVWLYVHGEWPPGRLDHENGETADNRFANLRLATHSQNIANSRLRRDSTSGLKGVSFYTSAGKWGANISKDGRRHYLGLFNTPEEAHAAYCAAAGELQGEFARTA